MLQCCTSLLYWFLGFHPLVSLLITHTLPCVAADRNTQAAPRGRRRVIRSHPPFQLSFYFFIVWKKRHQVSQHTLSFASQENGKNFSLVSWILKTHFVRSRTCTGRMGILHWDYLNMLKTNNRRRVLLENAMRRICWKFIECEMLFFLAEQWQSGVCAGVRVVLRIEARIELRKAKEYPHVE